MTRFTREQLEAYRDATVDDLVGDEVRLVFVGINPGLWTAATNTHFAHPSNRFYPALHLAGITPPHVDPERLRTEGHDPGTRAALTDRGIAITNLAPRATARADELSRDELREGGAALVERVAAWSPRLVAVVGLTAYRSAFGRRRATAGRQPEHDRLAGVETWVAPNPSGLNAHETVDSLAATYRAVAEAAGIELDPPRG